MIFAESMTRLFYVVFVVFMAFSTTKMASVGHGFSRGICRRLNPKAAIWCNVTGLNLTINKVEHSIITGMLYKDIRWYKLISYNHNLRKTDDDTSHQSTARLKISVLRQHSHSHGRGLWLIGGPLVPPMLIHRSVLVFDGNPALWFYHLDPIGK